MGKRGFAASLWRFCLVLILVFFVSGYALADEVVLKNGDRLSGKILEIKDGVLTLETSYSEPIILKFDEVLQMSSSEPVELHLADGEILKGSITTGANRQVAVEAGPEREAVAVGMNNIVALNPPPKEPATWKGNINVGGNWQDGNTDTMNVSAGALAVRRTENDRFLINFLYNKSEDDGRRTAENTWGQLKYDYFLSPKWYLYLNVDMLSDEFKDINFRTSVGPGVGYQFWEGDDKSLGLEAGVSYTNEDRDVGEDTDWLAARVGINFLYRLFDRVLFTDQFVIYPNLDDTGEYTLRNEAAFVTDIGASWALRLSNIWERNSNPGPGLEQDDFTWILGLQYSF
jgi:putative salt-induced outer membrane protein YdiY